MVTPGGETMADEIDGDHTRDERDASSADPDGGGAGGASATMRRWPGSVPARPRRPVGFVHFRS